MAQFKPNQANIHAVLNGAGGPVFRHVQIYLAEAQRIAKFAAPKDTGTLAASTRAVGPTTTTTGVKGSLTANAINSRTGRDYALAVHQGHKKIVPLTYPNLKFKWKGNWVTTKSVKARKGRPFLIEGLKGANAALTNGKFKIKINRPWRTNGS